MHFDYLPWDAGGNPWEESAELFTDDDTATRHEAIEGTKAASIPRGSRRDRSPFSLNGDCSSEISFHQVLRKLKDS